MRVVRILGETERLTIRGWSPEADLEAAFAIYGNSNVTRFLAGPPRESREEQAEVLRRWHERDVASDYLLGTWAIVRKLDQQVVGSVLLKHPASSDGTDSTEIEVGWHLAEEYWGNGYATEAATWALKYGFNELKLQSIMAILFPENFRSARVAERIGMERIGETDKFYGVLASYYLITRDSWTGLSSNGNYATT